jgi:outer membrane biosynthesis protein TonB
MRRPLVISGIAHVIVLGWGLVAFTARTNDAPQAEALPVEFISTTQFTQLTTGAKNAPKAIENPKPLADKVGDAKPVSELAPKVADKPEIKTDSKPAPQPKPETKPEPKAAENPEKPKDSKPVTDQVADALKKEEPKKPPKPVKKPPEFKPDQIAEELKKDEAKKPPSRYDANQIAALLDHREPRRQLATAETLNGNVALGAPTGHAAQLSQSELDALRARLVQCWSPPPGLNPDSKLYVVLAVQFKQDASLAQEPAVIEDAAASVGPALAESAKRAVLSCQPFTMLKPEHYDLWKYIEIKFNNELLGG